MGSRYEEVLEGVRPALRKHQAGTNIMLGFVSLLINFAILFRERSVLLCESDPAIMRFNAFSCDLLHSNEKYEEGKVFCLSLIADLLAETHEPAVLYRLLVVVGRRAVPVYVCACMPLCVPLSSSERALCPFSGYRHTAVPRLWLYCHCSGPRGNEPCSSAHWRV